jgi:hypothetical protein
VIAVTLGHIKYANSCIPNGCCFVLLGCSLGKDLVSSDMLEYQLHLSVNRAVAEGLIKQSAKDANLLFGWQVRVSAHMQDEGKGTLSCTAYYTGTAVTRLLRRFQLHCFCC